MKDFNWDAIPVKIGSVARPAAGNQYAAITVPAGKKWLFIGGAFQETTDVNVADRIMYLAVRADATNYNIVVYSSVVIAASQTTVRVVFYPGTGTSGSGTSAKGFCVGIGIPGIEVPAAGIINFGVDGIQVGDRPDGAVYYTYKEAPA